MGDCELIDVRGKRLFGKMEANAKAKHKIKVQAQVICQYEAMIKTQSQMIDYLAGRGFVRRFLDLFHGKTRACRAIREIMKANQEMIDNAGIKKIDA